MDDFSTRKQKAIKAVQEQDRIAQDARKNFRRTTSATDDFDKPWGLGWGGQGSWSPLPPKRITKKITED